MIKFAVFFACAFVAVQGDIFDDIREPIDKTLPEIIQKIKNKVSDDDFTLKEKIEERIKNAGEVGRKCADDQKSEIESLRIFSENRTKICIQEAESKIEDLRQTLKDLLMRKDLYSKFHEIVNTIAVAKQSAQEASAAVVECSNQVQKQAAIKTDQILADISYCIAPDS